jgi:hypothetical protein
MLGVGAALLLVACGGEPLEFADWTIPVPEGTPIHEYAAVPDEERAGNELVLERDLVIGRSGREDVAFYQATSPVVDDAGRIYVLDTGNHRVQVFDPAGELLLTFGAEGQGPGELSRPQGLAILGDNILVSDGQNSRVSEFTRDGAHVADHAISSRVIPRQFTGRADGTIVMAHYPSIPLGRELPEPVMWSVSRRTLQEEELWRYIEVPVTVGPYAILESGSRMSFFSVPMPSPYPHAELGPDGRVYATAGDQYQVLAIGDEGEALWALRVAERATAPTEEHIARAMEVLHSRNEELTRQMVNWPAQYAVIQALMLDGAGRLYVVPFRYQAPSDEAPAEPQPVPVDVYTPDGERVFAGTMAIPDWTAAHGDHVYRMETDEAGDQVLVRYRIASRF